MAGPSRPQFVLFGSSIVELSFQASNGGFGAILADLYYRQVLTSSYALFHGILIIHFKDFILLQAVPQLFMLDL